MSTLAVLALSHERGCIRPFCFFISNIKAKLLSNLKAQRPHSSAALCADLLIDAQTLLVQEHAGNAAFHGVFDHGNGY